MRGLADPRGKTVLPDAGRIADDVTFSAAYNTQGQRTSVTASIGTTEDYTNAYSYNNLRQVTQITQGDLRVEFGYDQFARNHRILRYENNNRVAATDQAFDDLGRIEEIKHSAGTDVFADYDYTWDAASRITDLAMEFLNSSYNDNVDYAYDNTGQLTDADYTAQADEDYDYDATGNRTLVDETETYTTGDHNRLTSDGVHTYTYDGEGNMVSKTKISDSTSEHYEWDHRNRVIRVTFKDALGDPTKIVEYAYVANNRMYRRTLDSDGDGTADTQTIFVRDNDQIVMEFEKSGTGTLTASNLKTRQLWDPSGIDRHLAQENVASETVFWSLPDHLNTVRDVVQYVSGNTTLKNHLTYAAFGEITHQTDNTITMVANFTGRWFDFVTRQQYNRERWYRPDLGRWDSVDPIGFEAGDVNLYRYVGNGPTNSVDPLGLVDTQYLYRIPNPLRTSTVYIYFGTSLTSPLFPKHEGYELQVYSLSPAGNYPTSINIPILGPVRLPAKLVDFEVVGDWDIFTPPRKYKTNPKTNLPDNLHLINGLGASPTGARVSFSYSDDNNEICDFVVRIQGYNIIMIPKSIDPMWNKYHIKGTTTPEEKIAYVLQHEMHHFRTAEAGFDLLILLAKQWEDEMNSNASMIQKMNTEAGKLYIRDAGNTFYSNATTLINAFNAHSHSFDVNLNSTYDDNPFKLEDYNPDLANMINAK